MKRFAYLFLILPSLILSEWNDPFKENSDPAIAHHVNVITGKLQLAFQDHIVKGAIPIPLVRTYTNFGMTVKAPADWQLMGGWNFFPQIHLYLDPREDDFKVYLREPNGKLLTYSAPHKDDHTLIMNPENYGNDSEYMTYRLNPNNHRLHLNYKKGEAILHMANGGKRIYKGPRKGFVDKLADYNLFNFERSARHYLLQEEISPSGQKTLYIYSDDKKAIKILQVNPSNTKVYSGLSLRQMNQHRPFYIHIATSDKQYLAYFGQSIEDRDYLSKVTSSLRPSESISYHPSKALFGAHLETIALPDRPNFRIEYYLPQNKKELKQYQTLDEKPPEAYKVKAAFDVGMKVATFTYTSNSTDVRDCDNILTRYYHKNGDLNHIEYFDTDDSLYSSQQFFWENGKLIAKAMCDAEGNPLFSKTFSYDEFGNLINETLYGNLTGLVDTPFQYSDRGALAGSDHYSRWRKYNQNTNLLTDEIEEDCLSYHYTYFNGTT